MAQGPHSSGGATTPQSDRAPRERLGALILEKNRPIGKRLARVLVSAGFAVKTFETESAEALSATIAAESGVSSWLVVAEQAAAGVMCALLSRPELSGRARGVLYASPGVTEDADVATLCEVPGLLGILGLRGAGRDQELELLCIANHLRGQPLMPLQAMLLWGASAYSTHVSSVNGRDAAEARIVKLCTDQLNVSSRLANSIGEVVHELLTNAMYGAPVDGQGRAIYAHDRTAPIQLQNDDRAVFRYGTDGMRLVIETIDRFGRLQRGDLVRSLRRAALGQVNRSQGGAGIGLSMVYRTASLLQVDVEPGARTRVSVVFELDATKPPSDGTKLTRSLIFPESQTPIGRRETER